MITLGRGKVISKKDIQNNPGDYPIYSSSATNNGLLGTYGDYMFEEELITWSIDGGGKFFYRPASRYSVTNVCGWLRVNDRQISTKYLYHFLLSEWQKKVFDYVHKAHPSTIRKEYAILVPPLEVQSEIVHILDNFTELTTKLTTELTAELASRKKQFEFYREELLSCNESVDRVNVGDLCDVITGGEPPTDCIKGNTPDVEHPYAVWGNGKDIYGYSKKYRIDKDAVVISSIGANTGAVYYRKAFFTPIIRLKVIIPKDEMLDIRYLYHALSASKITSKSSSVPNMNASEIKAIQFPLPNIKEQKKIVSILDEFDSICNGILSSLPTEIDARQKQYEFYRDKLLTFDELRAARRRLE